MKQWREDNKDHLKELKRTIYERHKDTEEFKEYNKEKSKEYYHINNEAIKEKRKKRHALNVVHQFVNLI